MIVVNNISKTYHTGAIDFLALEDVSLHVREGEYTSIMGPSGSGKSTFMNIIGCLDSLDAGNYLLRGVDVSSLKPNELAHVRNKEIGFVFQSFNLLPALTILENVELPMAYAGFSVKDRRVKAMEALEKVGLTNWIKHRPNEVSGGQKQRVSIARAIVNSPSIILADEPTGNLDSKSSEDIIKIFQDLNNEGATILIVTHESEVAKFSKRIVRFFDGKIVSDGLVHDRIEIANEGGIAE